MGGALAGKLLVASPVLEDPNFARAVVLMLEHTKEGALGLVINRASGTPVADPLPQWAAFAAEPSHVFVGGPVEPQAAICLALVEPDADPPGWRRLDGRAWSLGVLDLGSDPAWHADALSRLRVFAGYAGWSAGQLDAEISAGGWYVVDASAEDALDAEPDALWRRVLRRQGGTLAMVATFPSDPRLN